MERKKETILLFPERSTFLFLFSLSWLRSWRKMAGTKRNTSGWKVINTRRDKKGPVRDREGAGLQRVLHGVSCFCRGERRGLRWFELIRGTNERAAPTLKRMKRKLFSRRRARFLLLAPLISRLLPFIAFRRFRVPYPVESWFLTTWKDRASSFPRLWRELNIIDAPSTPVYSELSRMTWLALPNERATCVGIQEVSSRCW